MIELLIATHNVGKRDEMRMLLAEIPLQFVNLSDLKITAEPLETGTTFVQNAVLKARYYAKLTEKWTIAEDSGLEIDALNGEPGVYSARYGGAELNDVQRYELVLNKMRAVPAAKRTARFRTVAVLCSPDAQIKAQKQSAIEGTITTQPQGANGFGYDPIFWVPQYKMTTAMMPPQTKNKISHRGKAMRALWDDIRSILEV